MLATLLRNDRAIVWSGLVAVTLVAWVYLLLGAGMDMGAMKAGGMAMPGMMAVKMPAWTLGYATIVFVMWVVMMMAMMLPSAAPTVLLVARLATQRGAGGGGLAAGAAGLFASGYVLVWVAFSLAATALQWGLSSAGMLSPMMATTDRVLAAGVLIAAGIYQWTPFKDACLRNCRSPLAVLLNHWRPGRLGPLRSGWINGLYCLGCCWALMALLFVGGVMNFAWIGGLTLLVLVEKTLPWGGWTARIAGALLVLWGGFALVQAV
jgi:predicted metal-binding membrane protein